MEISFYLFLGMCEVMLILVIIIGVQAVFLKKYRPYFMANTRPEMFLRKYIQYLIKHTQKFAKGFNKSAKNGDETAIKTQQHMTARLNWLVLERDFATTTSPDIRYWEDINTRIKDMLAHWKEVEYIKEPPDVELIELAIEGKPEDFDFDNANLDEDVKKQIANLKKKASATSSYESMYKEMEMAYKTLEASYKELRDSVSDLKVDSGETEKLKTIIAAQEANEESLNAMMTEMEESKERLHAELAQLEDAFVELESTSLNSSILKNSDNIDAQEMLAILEQQQTLFSDFRKTLNSLNMKPSQQQKVDDHTDKMQKTHKEINHSMQMLELERERLEEEVRMLNDEGANQ